jgi:hypothetical protein
LQEEAGDFGGHGLGGEMEMKGGFVEGLFKELRRLA